MIPTRCKIGIPFLPPHDTKPHWGLAFSPWHIILRHRFCHEHSPQHPCLTVFSLGWVVFFFFFLGGGVRARYDSSRPLLLLPIVCVHSLLAKPQPHVVSTTYRCVLCLHGVNEACLVSMALIMKSNGTTVGLGQRACADDGVCVGRGPGNQLSLSLSVSLCGFLSLFLCVFLSLCFALCVSLSVCEHVCVCVPIRALVISSDYPQPD